jgi:hypothetical protein
MTKPVAAKEWVSELAGVQHAGFLQKHLEQLHSVYHHGNRTLFYDQLVCAYLLAFFNPAARSLRRIEDLSQQWNDSWDHHSTRLCRSTLSDANALMDATLLEPLIERLKLRCDATGKPLSGHDGQLQRLLKQVEVIDGSFFASAANVTWALRSRGGMAKRAAERRGDPDSFSFNVRLDLHLCGASGLPLGVSVAGKGQSESHSAAQRIEQRGQGNRGVIHIADRGLVSFAFINAVLKSGGDFVLRVKDDLNFTHQHKQELDEDDRAANILSDHLGELSGSPHLHAKRQLPHQQLRELVIFNPDNPTQTIRLITSLIDVPAHIVAQLYRWRWQIELFFRWLKVHARFAHLISRSKNGMTLGFHVAVIAVLLMYLRSGRPMSIYAYTLLCQVAMGGANIEDILPVLERRERECQRERQRQAAQRAAKKSV